MYDTLIFPPTKLPVSPGFDLEIPAFKFAKPLFELTDRNRSHLNKWLPWVTYTKTVDDTKRFIRFVRDNFQSNRIFNWMMMYKDEIIGMIGTPEFNIVDRNASIGYWIDRDHEGKGLVSIAVSKLLDVLFIDSELERVEIRCAVANQRSRSIPQRLGFQEEGTLKHAQKMGNSYFDLVIYGLIKEEFYRLRALNGK